MYIHNMCMALSVEIVTFIHYIVWQQNHLGPYSMLYGNYN